jgi:hypothetical protein
LNELKFITDLLRMKPSPSLSKRRELPSSCPPEMALGEGCYFLKFVSEISTLSTAFDLVDSICFRPDTGIY